MTISGHEVLPLVDVADVGRSTKEEFLRLMLLQRLFEERIMTLYRQGQIPGSVYTGRGQEAVAVGAGMALGDDDVVAPLNRELGCHFARGVTPADVFRNFMARATGPSFGRDGNMHFGVPERNIFPLVSMLGNLLPVVVGAALAFKQRGERRVAMTFLGEGAFSVGDVHEGLNLAGLWCVPVVVIIQSNQYSYSTPSAAQMVNTNIAERLRGGWSIPAERVDGTDILAVFSRVRDAVEHARSGGGPRAVEAVSLRIHGHAAHDAASYVDPHLRHSYETVRDPIARLEAHLLGEGTTSDRLDEIRREAHAVISDSLAEAERAPTPDPRTIEEGVYATPLE